MAKKESVLLETKVRERKHLAGPTGRNCIVPLVEVGWNDLITSAHEKMFEGGIVGAKKSVNEEQVVVVAGASSQYKQGDIVRINVEMFPHKDKPGGHDVGTVRHYYPPFETIGGTKYLFLSDRHIKFKYSDDSSTVK